MFFKLKLKMINFHFFKVYFSVLKTTNDEMFLMYN